jgi:iron(III) transport system ATP-binding protein
VKCALRIRDLEVRAGGRGSPLLLGPLDLDVAEGEYLVVAGPSGGGKTTLLRSIAGLATPARGTVELDGVLASAPGRLHVPPERRGVGMVFQGGALWPHMSAVQTLRFVLRRSGKDASPAVIAELLERVQLAGFGRRRPATLSGGERQRLALARALATRPRLLLLDEPLGPLDPELRGELAHVLGRVHAGGAGCTVLHVTHDVAEAAAVATRAVRIASGRIAAAPSAPEGGA